MFEDKIAKCFDKIEKLTSSTDINTTRVDDLISMLRRKSYQADLTSYESYGLTAQLLRQEAEKLKGQTDKSEDIIIQTYKIVELIDKEVIDRNTGWQARKKQEELNKIKEKDKKTRSRRKRQKTNEKIVKKQTGFKKPPKELTKEKPTPKTRKRRSKKEKNMDEFITAVFKR